MKDDFRDVKMINPYRLINSIKNKAYPIYDCFGGEARGMTTASLIQLINDELACSPQDICHEDLE